MHRRTERSTAGDSRRAVARAAGTTPADSRAARRTIRRDGLIQRNDRAPQFLYTKLEDRGYRYETVERDGDVVTVIWRSM